jgi:hypothetical protein
MTRIISFQRQDLILTNKQATSATHVGKLTSDQTKTSDYSVNSAAIMFVKIAVKRKETIPKLNLVTTVRYLAVIFVSSVTANFWFGPFSSMIKQPFKRC